MFCWHLLILYLGALSRTFFYFIPSGSKHLTFDFDTPFFRLLLLDSSRSCYSDSRIFSILASLRSVEIFNFPYLLSRFFLGANSRTFLLTGGRLGQNKLCCWLLRQGIWIIFFLIMWHCCTVTFRVDRPLFEEHILHLYLKYFSTALRSNKGVLTRDFFTLENIKFMHPVA